MARILYVEDSAEWIKIVLRALAGHEVDYAHSASEAIRLIEDGAPYDLALVDLHLRADADALGGDVLVLLDRVAPSTRRILITGSPPVGDLRRNVFDRYGVDEMILKGELTLPDLRAVVAQALESREPRGDITDELRFRKSELGHRYRSWRARIDTELSLRAREAGGGVGTSQEASADDDQPRWSALRQRFDVRCSELESVLASVTGQGDIDLAMEHLARGEAEFAEELGWPP
jgi:CheY-like chemotaxis protein